MPVGAAAPFLWGAVASAGGTAAGAAMQSRAAGKATRAQAEANAEATALERERMAEERRRWDAEEAMKAPYRQASQAALGRLTGLLGPQGQSAWRSPSQVGRVPVQLSDLVRRG